MGALPVDCIAYALAIVGQSLLINTIKLTNLTFKGSDGARRRCAPRRKDKVKRSKQSGRKETKQKVIQ